MYKILFFVINKILDPVTDPKSLESKSNNKWISSALYSSSSINVSKEGFCSCWRLKIQRSSNLFDNILTKREKGIFQILLRWKFKIKDHRIKNLKLNFRIENSNYLKKNLEKFQCNLFLLEKLDTWLKLFSYLFYSYTWWENWKHRKIS